MCTRVSNRQVCFEMNLEFLRGRGGHWLAACYTLENEVRMARILLAFADFRSQGSNTGGFVSGGTFLTGIRLPPQRI